MKDLEKVTFDKEVVELKAENALVEYSITDTNVKCLAYNAAPGTSADQLVIFEAPDEATAKTTLTQAQAYISDMAGVYESYAPEEAAKLNNAVIAQNGNYVVVVVATDATPAAAIVK